METDEPLNWGEVFFTLHKHCNLNKWEIWEYTIPQVAELMKSANRYIQFEVETRITPLSIFGGGGQVNTNTKVQNDEDYHEATEDDINFLARALGGG